MQTHQFSEEQNKTLRSEGRNYLKKVCSFIENYFSKSEHVRPEKKVRKGRSAACNFHSKSETKAEITVSVNPELDG